MSFHNLHYSFRAFSLGRQRNMSLFHSLPSLCFLSCWLSLKNGAIWAFVAPALFVIVVSNLQQFALVIFYSLQFIVQFDLQLKSLSDVSLCSIPKRKKIVLSIHLTHEWCYRWTLAFWYLWPELYLVSAERITRFMEMLMQSSELISFHDQTSAVLIIRCCPHIQG